MVRLKAWLSGLLIALSLGGAAMAQNEADVLGPWRGTLVPQGSTGVTVLLTIAKGADGALGASFSQPYSGSSAEVPAANLAVKDGVLSFAIPRANASYEGKWDAAGRRWQGVFKAGGMDLPLTLEAGKPPARPVVAGLDGTWQGAIERNGAKLRLILRIATAGYGTVAVLDSPDQLSYGQEVPVVSHEGARVALGIPATQASYAAMLSADGASMTGVWKRPGQPDAEVTFARAAGPVARISTDRPQTPKPPFDYRVEQVTFGNPFETGISLAGTLTLPKGPGPFPAAVLISGSGANDRDDTTLGHKPFAVIADHLTKAGFAVLRYDDRGVGGSKGDHATADSVDFATDANSAARYLRGRPEIKKDAIGFIGHSEGGVTAPLAMASNRDIAFLVLLAGPGVRWERVVLSQWRMSGELRGKSQAELDRTQPLVGAIYHAIGAAKSEDDAVKALVPLLTPEALVAMGAPPNTDRAALARQMASRWGRYLFAYDPAPNLRKIRVPVLAMGGSLDQQIPSGENLPAIKAALAGDRDVTIKEFPGLNHLFQTAKTGAAGEYADISETFAPAALDFMTDWLTKRFVKR